MSKILKTMTEANCQKNPKGVTNRMNQTAITSSITMEPWSIVPSSSEALGMATIAKKVQTAPMIQIHPREKRDSIIQKTSQAASEPQVPGPGVIHPTPKNVV